jgi:alanine-glyoxylate transaminase/serine-glyoxylate transaminase/serine-pyruvate transaminase
MAADTRARLMVPGPVDVEEDVLAAVAQPVLPHYGEAWLAIYHEVLDSLKQVFGTQNDLVPVVGPGSAGLDAAIGSLMRTGDKVLVPQNGFFGERLAAIAGSYGLEVRNVIAPLGQPVEPEAVRRVLAAEPGIQALAVVHVETSTAVLNPLQEIAAVAHEFDVPLVVDAVSSMGGIPVPVDEWGIDLCVTVSNKSLASLAGVAPISVSPRAWDLMERRDGGTHGWYLNLRTWREFAVNWSPWHPYPTTLPTGLFVALRASLRHILAEGLEATYARHVEAAETVRRGLARLGLALFVPEEHLSPLITAIGAPRGIDLEELRRYLLQEWQVMVAGGLAGLRGKVLRVGHMGKAASVEYGERFLQGVDAFFRVKGYEVPLPPND